MRSDDGSGPVSDEDTHLRSSTSPTVAVEYDAGVLSAAALKKQHVTRVSGDLVDNRYRLEDRLGGGGMGIVFRARDRLMEEAHDPDPYVAIKVIGDAIKEHPQAAIALQREAHRSQSLSHPNIVKVFHFGKDASSYYLTMELLVGQSLEEVIKARPGGIGLKDAIGMIRHLCEALSYAHKEGIVHSDIKPSNIFVTRNQVVKVLDFGIATPLLNRGGKGRETLFDPRRLGAVSPRYSSVEMWLGMEADPRDDVYSAACVIYELLSGQHPFGKKSAPEALEAKKTYQPIDALGARRNRALARALAFRREDRTPSIAQVLTDLELPTKGARTTALGISVAAAALISAGAWLVFHQRADDGDNELLTSLVTVNAPRSDDYDGHLVEILFDLADGYVATARDHYDAGILSEGVSSAYGSYRNILELDPGNLRAGRGILDVWRLHRAEAHRLYDSKDYAHALEVVDYGLRINPKSVDLQNLKQKITQQFAGAEKL